MFRVWRTGLMVFTHVNQSRCSNPLTLGARPLRVWTDGHQTVSRPWTEQPPVAAPVDRMQIHNASCSDNIGRYVVTNVGVLYADEGVVLKDVGILVEDGVVQCIQKRRGCLVGRKGVEIYDLRGGSVVPVWTLI